MTRIPTQLSADLRALIPADVWGRVEKLIAEHLNERDHIWLRIVELHCSTDEARR
jgi:hypothetical protein